MKIVRWALLTCIFCIYLFSPVFGCEYNVRDIGFVDLELRPYHLYYYVQDNTPQDFISTFRRISFPVFEETNVTSEIINVTQQKNHPAIEYFRFWELQSFPAVILVSPDGRSLVLSISFPLKPLTETLGDSLESVVSSPVREEILKRIVRTYCIILLFEGKDTVKNNKIHEEVDGAVQKIVGMMKQLPKRIEEPPFIITIPQELCTKEKILLWSLNLDEQEMNESHTVIIYGRGHRFGPMLIGEQISQRNLVNILTMIGLSCECGLDRKWTMGPLLPLRWEKRIQSDVVKYLGFDAENPVVKMEISQILSLNLNRTFENNSEKESTIGGYGEEILKREENESSNRITPSQFQALLSQGTITNPILENHGSIQNSEDRIYDSSKVISFIKSDSSVPKVSVNQSQESKVQKSVSTGITYNLKVSLFIVGIIVLVILAGGGYIFLQKRME